MDQDVPICTENLSKTYGKGRDSVHALENVNLEVQAGQVYGFLGPNGAGKSTTIRLIMDLIRPSEGRVYIFGRNVNKHPETLKRVGALVEGATFYDYMTGRENLKVLGYTAGSHKPERMDELLDLLDMSGRADRRVDGYSTGMKQRLGIAAALLNDPELVILDEPTNGLDPAGIQEIRGFIRSLVKEYGKTVFLSSHLLNEVEQVCDRVAIISKGIMIREGAVADLLSDAGQVLVQVNPVAKAVEALKPYWNLDPDREWLTIYADPDDSPRIIKLLMGQNINVKQVVIKRRSLEEFFMEVTKDGTDDV